MGRQIRARGGRLSSLCERGARVSFCGDELQADGCVRGRRGEGWGGSRARGSGDGLLARGADERWSPTRGELVEGDGFSFPFFSLRVVRVGSPVSGHTVDARRPGASNVDI